MKTTGGTPVWVTGEGPALVLIHGVLMDHRMWAAQVSALAGSHRVLCLDMLGHGQAPDPPGSRTLQDFVAQVHEVVTELAGPSPAVLGGFSMGGLVAQAYAIQHHESLAGLILMNAVYDRSPQESASVRARLAAMESGEIERVTAPALARWFTETDRHQRREAVELIMGWVREGDLAIKRKAYRVFANGDRETANRLGAIGCPTLVMTGEHDAGSPPHMARAMAGAIEGAELRVLEDQRHMMPVLDSARVNRTLLDFLNRIQGGWASGR